MPPKWQSQISALIGPDLKEVMVGDEKYTITRQASSLPNVNTAIPAGTIRHEHVLYGKRSRDGVIHPLIRSSDGKVVRVNSNRTGSSSASAAAAPPLRRISVTSLTDKTAEVKRYRTKLDGRRITLGFIPGTVIPFEQCGSVPGTKVMDRDSYMHHLLGNLVHHASRRDDCKSWLRDEPSWVFSEEELRRTPANVIRAIVQFYSRFLRVDVISKLPPPDPTDSYIKSILDRANS